MGKHGSKKKVEKVDWTALIDQAWGSDSESDKPKGHSESSPMPVELAGSGCLNSVNENEAAARSLASDKTGCVFPEINKTKGKTTEDCDCVTGSNTSIGAKAPQKETLYSENSFAGKLLSEDPLQPLISIPKMPTNMSTLLKSRDTLRTEISEGAVSSLHHPKDRVMQTTLDSESFDSDILLYADQYPHSCLSGQAKPGFNDESTPQTADPPKVTARKIPRELFPIFDTKVVPSTSAKTSPVGRQTQKENRRKRPAGNGGGGRHRVKRPRLALQRSKQENMQQLHLDLGQKTFGHVTCEVCGMVYTFGQPDDQAEHIKFHKKFISGVKFLGWKNERVVQQFHDGRIVVILPTDPKHHLKKVEEILAVVDGELGYATGATVQGKMSKVFVFVSTNKTVMGCVVAETISEGYRVLSSTNGGSAVPEGLDLSAWFCSPTPEPAMVGINRIWVSTHFRRRGVASRLMDTVRTEFIPSYVVPRDLLAFSDPTPDGKAFATNYSSTPNFLVYRWT